MRTAHLNIEIKMAEEKKSRADDALRIAYLIKDYDYTGLSIKLFQKIKDYERCKAEENKLPSPIRDMFQNVREKLLVLCRNNMTVIGAELKTIIPLETQSSQLADLKLSTFHSLSIGIENGKLVFPMHCLTELSNALGDDGFHLLCKNYVTGERNIAEKEEELEKINLEKSSIEYQLIQLEDTDDTPQGKFLKLDSDKSSVYSARWRLTLILIATVAALMYEYIDGTNDSLAKQTIVCVGSAITLIFGVMDYCLNTRGNKIPQDNSCRIVAWRCGYIKLMRPGMINIKDFFMIRNKICCYCCLKGKYYRNICDEQYFVHAM